jgi:pimeloyl-ACP methyl ester carboxylesterase
VADLLRQLGIAKADVLGFSNGGQTALQLGMSHPDQVRKLVVASAFYNRDGAPPGFWQGMAKAQFSDMPQPYKDAFAKVNSDPAALHNMFNKDAHRMQTFQGWTDAEIRSIQAPTFVVIGDHDVVKPEHAVKLFRLLPQAQLAILPGTHGSYLGELLAPHPDSKVPDLFVAMVDEFLAAKDQ